MSAPSTTAWVQRWRQAVLESRSGIFFSLFRLCCRIVSFLYRGITTLRQWMYRAGLLRTHAAPSRVISVGNIAVGGTGKTPLVSLMADRLTRDGLRPAILTRGYGRRSSDMVFLPDETAGWERAGDEPLMLSAMLPSVPIVVSADRLAAAQAAWDRFQPHVYLLDDGMQHLRVRRDLEIVVIDTSCPLQQERIFPAGRLREPLTALRRADLFFLTRTEQSDRTREVSEFLRRYHPRAAQVHSIFRPYALRKLPGGEQRELESLSNQPVLAFSGIGNPEALESSLKTSGACLVGRRHFPDHHPYTRRDIDCIEKLAKDVNARMIVTTEKDAVRLENIDRCSIPFLALLVRIEITSGADTFWRTVTGGS